jgi:hypothetical protein
MPPIRTIEDYEVLNNRCIQKCPPGKVRDNDGKKSICTSINAPLRGVKATKKVAKSGNKKKSLKNKAYSPDLDWKPAGYIDINNDNPNHIRFRSPAKKSVGVRKKRAPKPPIKKRLTIKQRKQIYKDLGNRHQMPPGWYPRSLPKNDEEMRRDFFGDSSS